MEIIQVDGQGRLFIGPDIDDWEPLSDHGITAIIDLDDDLDSGVPQILNDVLYIYFPIDDGDLPELDRMEAVARMAAHLIASGQKLISHCGMGHNRCALMAGSILTFLGLSGPEAVALLRSRRPGALYNKKFAAYLMSVEARPIQPGLQIVAPEDINAPLIVHSLRTPGAGAPGAGAPGARSQAQAGPAALAAN